MIWRAEVFTEFLPPPSVFPVLLVPALPGRLQRKRRRRRRKRRRRRRRRRKRRRRNARGRLALGPISITDEHLPDGSCKQRPGTGEKRKKNKKNEHKRKTPSNQQNNKKNSKTGRNAVGVTEFRYWVSHQPPPPPMRTLSIDNDRRYRAKRRLVFFLLPGFALVFFLVYFFIQRKEPERGKLKNKLTKKKDGGRADSARRIADTTCWLITHACHWSDATSLPSLFFYRVFLPPKLGRVDRSPKCVCVSISKRFPLASVKTR